MAIEIDYVRKLEAENQRFREALREIKSKGLTTGYGRAALSRIAHEALNAVSSKMDSK